MDIAAGWVLDCGVEREFRVPTQKWGVRECVLTYYDVEWHSLNIIGRGTHKAIIIKY